MCPDPSLKELNIKQRKELKKQTGLDAGNLPGTAVAVFTCRISHPSHTIPHSMDVDIEAPRVTEFARVPL